MGQPEPETIDFVVFQRTTPELEQHADGRSWVAVAHVWAYDAADAIGIVADPRDRLASFRWLEPSGDASATMRSSRVTEGGHVPEIRIYRARRADTRV